MRGPLSAALALVAAGALLSCADAAIDCSAMQECDPRNRRILFILDASLSIGQTNFDNQMIDYVTRTFCGFRNTANGARYEAGVITFNSIIETKIPFQQFTPAGFDTAVRRDVRKQVPLRCCTSHAEAAVLALEMFSDPSLDDGFQNIAFIITDGSPMPNYERTIRGSAAMRNFYLSRNLDIEEWTQDSVVSERDEERVKYAAELVPAAMRALKEAGVRVFFIGVPNMNADDELEIGYFNGSSSTVCMANSGASNAQISCGNMTYLPLVSEPAAEHAFGVNTWDMDPLVAESLDRICREWTPEPGCNGARRDVLVLLDTSESMDEARFRSSMMDVIKNAGAALGFSSGSRFGLATFGSAGNTRLRIPLTEFGSAVQLNASVDAFEADAQLDCCTNLAEALDLAQSIMRAAFREGQDKIVLVVTDGTPFQNFGTDPFEWRRGEWTWRKNRCEYVTQVVPSAARRLRSDGVRVVLAGVPNTEGREPMADFFDGALVGEQCCVNPETNQACLVDGQPEWCADGFNTSATIACEDYTADKVVSDGVNNIFSTDSWDVANLTARINEMLCMAEPFPTPPPTQRVPSALPTRRGGNNKNPTRSPTARPSFVAAVDDMDLLIVLDTSKFSAAETSRCRNGGWETDCKTTLLNAANDLRKALLGGSNSLRVGVVAAGCAETNALSLGRGKWTREWSSSASDSLEMVRAARVLSSEGSSQCLVPGLLRAEQMLSARKNAFANRPAAVLLLTHGGDTGAADDACAAATKAAAMRLAHAHMTTFAVTASAATGAHLSSLAALAGSGDRVFDALQPGATDALFQKFREVFVVL